MQQSDIHAAAVSLGRAGGLKGGAARSLRLTAEQKTTSGQVGAAHRWNAGLDSFTQIERVLDAYENGCSTSLEVSRFTGLDLPTCSNYTTVLFKRGELIRIENGKRILNFGDLKGRPGMKRGERFSYVVAGKEDLASIEYDIILLPYCKIPPDAHENYAQLWVIPLPDGRTAVACRQHYQHRHDAVMDAMQLIGSKVLAGSEVSEFIFEHWGPSARQPWPMPPSIDFPGPGRRYYYTVSSIVRAMGPRPRHPCDRCRKVIKGAAKIWQITDVEGCSIFKFCSKECRQQWKKGKGWRKMQLVLLQRAAADLKKLRQLCRDPEALAACRLQEQESRQADSSQA